MEKVSSILADFRLNFGDDQKRHVMTSREKCSKSIELVDSLLLCSQQQIDQFLSPSLDSLLKLATDESRDVRQASGFGSKLIYVTIATLLRNSYFVTLSLYGRHWDHLAYHVILRSLRYGSAIIT